MLSGEEPGFGVDLDRGLFEGGNVGVEIFEDYLNDEKNTKKGRPKNEDLVANISRIREAVLDDLWTSKIQPPSLEGIGGNYGLMEVARASPTGSAS